MSHPYCALIHDCKWLIQFSKEAHLRNLHYEGNFCADLLAKKGLFFVKLVAWIQHKLWLLWSDIPDLESIPSATLFPNYFRISFHSMSNSQPTKISNSIWNWCVGPHVLNVFYLKLLGLIFARVCKEVAWNTILLLQGLIFVDLIFYIRRGVAAIVEMGKNRAWVWERKRWECVWEKSFLFVWLFDICGLQFGIVREVCYRLVLVLRFGDLLSLGALQLLDLICGSLFGLCAIRICIWY